MVVIRNPPRVGENSKLQPKFRGPYIIRKCLDRNRFVVGDLDHYQVSGRPFTGIFDPNNMKLYKRDPPDAPFENIPECDPELNESAEKRGFLGYDLEQENNDLMQDRLKHKFRG